MFRIDKSKQIYLLIVLLAIAGKIILTLFPVDHPIVRMPLFNWLWIIIIVVAGYFVFIPANKAGFAPLWDNAVSPQKRILLPVSFGLVCASFQIIFCVHLEFPNFNVPFPHSIPAYLSFGTFYEIAFHFVPVVVLTWFVSTLLLKQKYSNHTFLIIAFLLSLFEPYTQINGLVAMNILSGTWIIVFFTILIFLANFIPLLLLRYYGFLSMILFRYTNYLLWHITWPLIYYSA